MLTPLVLFPLLWVFRSILSALFQNTFSKINAAFVTLVILVATAAGTYWMFVESPKSYATFLTVRGYETDATVTAIRAGNSVLTGGPYSEVEFTYKNQQGLQFTQNYISIPRRFYPILQKPILLPEIGTMLRIRMPTTVDSGFVVLTDSKKSTYGEKLECNETRLVLSKAELRHRKEDFPSQTVVKAYRDAINQVLELNCIDLKERDRLREILGRLK